jgi:cytochrome oxidase Cu insertion factor (SCO1/SenC/PrrC family)
VRGRTLVIVTIILTASVVAAACGSEAGGPKPPAGYPGVGDEAPPFALTSSDGGRVSLSHYFGRSVLLYFSMGPG